MTEIDKARLFLNTAIQKTIVPLIRQGAAKIEKVSLLCKHLREEMERRPQQPSAMALEGATTEMTEICIFLEALNNPQAPCDATALDKIMTAKSGGRLLVKQAALLSTTYKQAEVKMRSAAVASKTMLPQMKSLETLMTGDPPDIEGIISHMKDIPRWDDALRPGQPPSERASKRDGEREGNSRNVSNCHRRCVFTSCVNNCQCT